MTGPPPRPVPHPALTAPPLGLAHRGFTPPVPGRTGHAWENTIEAFTAARATGLRHLELDVHATRDGVCAVVHDPDLRRVAGVDARVRDLAWEQVRRLRVRGEHPVPRLEEVLDAFPDAVLNVDCKTPATVAPLVATLRARPVADRARVLVASFDGRRSAAVARAVPGVARSAGTIATLAVRLAAVLPGTALPRVIARRWARGAHALQVPERYGPLRVVTPRFVELAHDVGLQVHVWVVDDPRDMRRLLDLGVDGLVGDRADLLAAVLRERRAPGHRA
ncbi:MAG: glycerophosphodiester phosphodiesterase family protein [Kineosporiaceae bacterium]